MPEQTKENGIQLDIEKDLLADAIFETQGRLTKPLEEFCTVLPYHCNTTDLTQQNQ